MLRTCIPYLVLDMSTLSDDLSDDFVLETTVENADSPVYKKEVDHTETPLKGELNLVI